jgi:hypothetical protein
MAVHPSPANPYTNYFFRLTTPLIFKLTHENTSDKLTERKRVPRTYKTGYTSSSLSMTFLFVDNFTYPQFVNPCKITRRSYKVKSAGYLQGKTTQNGRNRASGEAVSCGCYIFSVTEHINKSCARSCLNFRGAEKAARNSPFYLFPTIIPNILRPANSGPNNLPGYDIALSFGDTLYIALDNLMILS